MRHLFTLACALATLSACNDKNDDCNADLMIAVELRLTVPEGVTITKVTAENESERSCEFSRGDDETEELYACYGQGGGDYIIRVYSGDDVIYTETNEVDANECKVKERAVSEVDLGAL